MIDQVGVRVHEQYMSTCREVLLLLGRPIVALLGSNLSMRDRCAHCLWLWFMSLTWCSIRVHFPVFQVSVSGRLLADHILAVQDVQSLPGSRRPQQTYQSPQKCPKQVSCPGVKFNLVFLMSRLWSPVEGTQRVAKIWTGRSSCESITKLYSALSSRLKPAPGISGVLSDCLPCGPAAQ